MFKAGDRVSVIKVGEHLHHKIGDCATVVRGNGNYRRIMRVRWDSGSISTQAVFCDQFAHINKATNEQVAPLPDTRDYLKAITQEDDNE